MCRELADLLDYCQLERRLAPPTCSAYERDIGSCLAFVEREGIATVLDLECEVRTAWLARVFNWSATDVRTLTGSRRMCSP